MATSIAALPLELLTETFVGAQSHSAVSHDRGQAEENARVAIAVSQVCHRWREAALGFPALWVYIAWGTYNAHRLHLLSAQIERCKGRPMIFNILYPGDVCNQMLVHDSIARHFPNAKEISVENCTTSMLTTILKYDAPHLYFLRIETFSMIKLPSAVSKLLAKNFKSLKGVYLRGMDVASLNLVIKAEKIMLANVRFPVHTFLGPSSSTLTTMVLLHDEISVSEARLDSPLVLPALQYLRVMAHLAPPVLLAINMPRLKILVLSALKPNSFTYFLSLLPVSWALRPPTKLKWLEIDFMCVQEEHEMLKNSDRLELMFSVFSNIDSMWWKGHSWVGLVESWGKRLGEPGEDGKAKMPNLREIALDKEDSHAALVDALAAQRPELSVLYEP
ncbi:hypothetical protein CYLTODRAFT_489993 [Cylindrobasidium torrendii FP15055 ss-10]|uniref:F-box domain-containing protein n=1 Tax=Cylindrobasidium torrendii FP15055 ss-10 TaxID=1314674 RepID=A0A0D7BEZ7_9AGAR|nr:hypothetical protein CYLTODRAFT_489993 [Cylindrobasidium torrendii FP15055 ss-10]